MTPSTATAPLSFEDYIAYDDGTENRYELVDGELVEMPPPIMEHFLIAKFLEQALDIEIKRLQHPWLCFRESGVRTGLRKSRITDVSMVTLDQAQELKGRSVVFATSPLLVIEVVSPDSITRNYRYKRTEYAALEIPEYWIVDPLESKVTVLTFNEGLYDETVFLGDQPLVSPTLPELSLTAEQIWAAGKLS
ncbi:Uma2 family endonuclease [Nodosilinea sp. PGN35]|uniref:Uma2 family endonuclease n=1 Tax=Nodosilinea sp. PGN35 TaxID=3020489 RepID=UPI0023B2AB8C|nr:Uma2 family endonuclease [Nodosilinea sp. TSF1-S3]MDF0365027.1 Uma2 family endonuclease [Nodosilinea sp. TSF1-S3]